MKREAEEAASKTLEMSVKQAESVRRQVIGSAELEVRNAQLRSLESAVTEVFEAAMKRVSEVTGAAQEKALSRLIEEGADVIGTKARLLCSDKDRKSASSALGKLGGRVITLDPEGIQTSGGVILTSADGSVRFDNTFEARLERLRPSLRKEVAALLESS